MEKTPDGHSTENTNTKSNLNKITNVKNKLFSKLGSMITSGKQKVKQKLDRFKNSKNISEREMNVKVQSIVKDKKENPTFTKVLKKEKREEDIFKIEEDIDGENFKVVIKDEDSDEEDDYVVVRKDPSEEKTTELNLNDEDITSNENNIPIEKETGSSKDMTGIKKYINEDDYKIEDDETFIQENQDIFTISHRLLCRVI